ncbi:hypothetical protein [Bifidobacterium tissieri]|uniref:hypothetical protein n=1 Tax=Bifidobacterium tissieri TaxID=1630162 RepID=UPI00123B4C89|nr:hypothetical protein [Bifidobacterium tissieri]KAA8832619.1 hypothetical protein EM849_03700 [Bifidobacterium tissieri]
MAYQKLNLQDGHVLDATDMAHIEQGIVDASTLPEIGQTVSLLPGVDPVSLWPGTMWICIGEDGQRVLYTRIATDLPDAPAGLPTRNDVPSYTGFPAVTVVDTKASDYYTSTQWFAKTIPTGPTAGKGAHHIQAHGGGITREGDIWYWVGESHENGYGDSPGIHLYTSKDLRNWTDMGIILRMITNPTAADDPTTPDGRYFHDLYGSEYENVRKYLLTHADGKSLTAIAERPKMLHNPRTDKRDWRDHDDGTRHRRARHATHRRRRLGRPQRRHTGAGRLRAQPVEPVQPDRTDVDETHAGYRVRRAQRPTGGHHRSRIDRRHPGRERHLSH